MTINKVLKIYLAKGIKESLIMLNISAKFLNVGLLGKSFGGNSQKHGYAINKSVKYCDLLAET